MSLGHILNTAWTLSHKSRLIFSYRQRMGCSRPHLIGIIVSADFSKCVANETEIRSNLRHCRSASSANSKFMLFSFMWLWRRRRRRSRRRRRTNHKIHKIKRRNDKCDFQFQFLVNVIARHRCAIYLPAFCFFLSSSSVNNLSFFFISISFSWMPHTRPAMHWMFIVKWIELSASIFWLVFHREMPLW